VQKEVKRKSELERVRGTLKVAELQNDDVLKGCVTISLYDSKPVYLLSSASEKIYWKKINRKLWKSNENQMVDAPFFRLNVIDDYNHTMGNVDISDQLRGTYRWDKWMRKRKWWWSIFFWNMQLLLTNSYIVYKKYMSMHHQKYMSQYDFRCAIAIAWLDPDTYWKRRVPHKQTNTSCSMSSLSTFTSLETRSTGRGTRATRFTDRALDPDSGVLMCRLVPGNHWPNDQLTKESNCQLHKWLNIRTRRKISYCAGCNVQLCIQCFKFFHSVRDLVGAKRQLIIELTEEAESSGQTSPNKRRKVLEFKK